MNGLASDARSWRVEAIGKAKKNNKIEKEVEERPEHQNAFKTQGKTIKTNGKPKQAEERAPRLTQQRPGAPRSTKEHPGAPRSAQDPKSIEKQTIFSTEAQKVLKNKRFLAWRPKKY